MTPHQVLLIMWRRGWVVVLTLLSVVMGAAVVMWLVPPRYEAIATASIDPAQMDPVTGLPSGGGSLNNLLQGNSVSLVKSRRVAAVVVERLGLATNPALVSRFRTSGAASRGDITILASRRPANAR